MASNFNPFRFLDPASQNTTGRGGAGTSRGGITYLGGVPRPAAPVTPTTQLQSQGRNRGRSLGLSPVIGMAPGNYGMGRDDGRRISARPTFLSSDAYYRARGSGLDWLDEYGPTRGSTNTSQPGTPTYGGRTATSAPVTPGSDVGSLIGGETAIPDQGDVPLNDSSPRGRYNRMATQQQMLLSAGLEDGKKAVEEVQKAQLARPPIQGSIIPEVGGKSPGATLRSPYGSGRLFSLGGERKSFGQYGSPTPEAARQAELGEKAIASRNRAGISTPDLIASGRRRFRL